MTIMIFGWLAKKLCFLGKLLGIPTGLFLFAVIGFVLDNPPVSLERNTMNAQYISNGNLQFGKYDIIIPNITWSSKPNQFAVAVHFSRQDRNLDVNSLEICPCGVSGVSLSSGMQCTITEGQNLHNTEDSKCSESSYPEPCYACQEIQSVCAPNHTCKIKQGNYLLKIELPPSSYLKTVKDKSQQFLVKKFGTSAIYKGEVNNCLVQRSYNTWCSNDKTCVSSGASGDRSHPQVFLLKFNFLSLVSLILLLVDGMFGLMGRRPGISIGIAIIVLSLGFVLKSENGLPPTLFQNDFATLIYGMAYSLMFVSLMLEQANREQLSHLFAGVAYAGVTFGILGYNFSLLPLPYACAGLPIFFFFVLFAVHHGTSARS